MKKEYSFLIAFIWTVGVYGQYRPILDPYLVPNKTFTLSKDAKDSLTYRQFAKIVTGESSPSNFVSFASFNPSDPSFSASAFIRTRWQRFNANLSIKGSLLDDKLSGLFLNEGTINTNTGGNVKINIRLDKPSVIVDQKDVQTLNEKTIKLKNKLNYDTLRALYNLKMLDFFIDEQQRKLSAVRDSLVAFNKKITLINSHFESCAKDAKCVSLKKDSIGTLVNKINLTGIDTVKIRAAIDSLMLCKTLNEMDSTTYHDLKQGKSRTYKDDVIAQYKEKSIADIRLLEVTLKPSIINVCWLSLGTGLSDQSFKAYNSNLAFSDQIFDRSLTTHNYNLDFNWFYKDSVAWKRFFLNVGVQYKITNNVTDLSSFIINQQTSYTNGANINRTVKKDYIVYTDSLVKPYNSISIYANFYYSLDRFQKNTIHLYPYAEKRNDNKEIYNFLIGYIFAFTKSKTEKELLNVEIYLKANDLRQQLDPESTFKKNLQMGISFTIPFTLNIN